MQKVIQQHQDYIPDSNTQNRLNQPLKDEQGLNQDHENFLQKLIKLLESGKLDPLNIQTIFNPAVHDNLNEDEKEKTDLSAFNIMGIIKQIDQLWKLDHKETFQIKNLVETVYQMKSKFEAEHGDVYII